MTPTHGGNSSDQSWPRSPSGSRGPAVNIPDAIHICQACEQGVASGVDMNGLPRICSDCVIERTIFAIAFRDLQRNDRNRQYQELHGEAAGAGVCMPDEEGDVV